MIEFKLMLNYPSMIKKAALCTVIYAVLAVMLKSAFVIIPEVTEIRIVNALPLAFGIIFGPAGAAGCAIGNLIGDFNGSLTILSSVGFIVNFLAAYLPYKFWQATAAALGEDPLCLPSYRSKAAVPRLLGSAVISNVPCGALLGITLDAYGSLASINAFNMVFLNDFIATIAFGLLIFFIFSKLAAHSKFFWMEDMKEDYLSGNIRLPSITSGRILLVSSLVCVGFALAYNLILGIGFTAQDELHSMLPLVVFSAYTLCLVGCTVSFFMHAKGAKGAKGSSATSAKQK